MYKHICILWYKKAIIILNLYYLCSYENPNLEVLSLNGLNIGINVPFSSGNH